MVSHPLRSISKLMTPLARRVRLMIGRSIIHLIDDTKNLQSLQCEILRDDVVDEVERFQEYGFTSHPKPGAEAIVACVGGSRAHAIVIAVDDRRFRLKSLAEGEVALYTDEGDYVLLKRGRNIEVLAGTKAKVTAPEVELVAIAKVRLTTPLTEIQGNVTVNGNVTVTGGNITADGIGLKTHTHGGVQPGSGSTGGPSG